MRQLCVGVLVVCGLALSAVGQVPGANWGSNLSVTFAGTGTALDGVSSPRYLTPGNFTIDPLGDGTQVDFYASSPVFGGGPMAVLNTSGGSGWVFPISVSADGVMSLGSPTQMGFGMDSLDLSGATASGSLGDVAGAFAAGVDTTLLGSVETWIGDGMPGVANADGSPFVVPVGGSGGGLATTAVPVAADLGMVDLIVAAAGCVGAWIVGTLLGKAGVAGVHAVFRMFRKGTVGLIADDE